MDPFDVPAPVLFNAWKHHAGWLREQIRLTRGRGEDGMVALARNLLVVGQELMDLYAGPLSPHGMAAEVLTSLTETNRIALQAYAPWIDAGGGFQVVTASDASRWVLRLGADSERYVHVHPGRWTPHTHRVRANVLKTAVMVLAYVPGRDVDVAAVNYVRKQYLGLSPIPSFHANEGLGHVLGFLQDV